MGLIRIRKPKPDYDRALARRFEDLRLGEYDTPEKMLAHCLAELQRYGVRIAKKAPMKTKYARMTTAFYRQVRVGTTWDRKSTAAKAVTLAHELVHIRQWRHFGRIAFGSSYVFSARWRWAMEMNAYRESMRAMKILGYSKTHRKNSATTRGPSMYGTYALRGLRRDHVVNYTREVLLAA